MKLENILIEYGLTVHEAKLFLACLELGSASAYQISKKAGLPRSSCYEVLEDLKKEGLVTSFYKKSIKYFSAEDPRVIINKIKARAEMFEQVLPQFNAIFNSYKIKPVVRFYEGVAGMKKILEEVLDETKEMLVIGSADDYFSALDDYLPKFLERRLKRKIFIKTILKESGKARERQKLGREHLREARILPERYQYHGLSIMWNNKIAMFSFGTEMLALVIESKEMSQTQKTLFNFMWDSLGN